MSADEGTGAAPAAGAAMQFDQVELASPEAARACRGCGRAIADEYFEVGGNVVCRTCADALAGPRGGAAFLRALLFGGGAALLGTIVWYAIIKSMDAEYGLVAIGVGLFVGFAVRKGARGRGGWKYQALAILLTYASITTSKVPFVIQGIVESAKKRGSEQAAGNSTDSLAPTSDSAAADDAAPAGGSKDGGIGAVAVALLFILGLALASPFLGGTSNIMGLIIIAIALYEAWKLNKRVPVSGPFQLRPPVVAPAPLAAP
jgi:ribosomal protein S27E